MRSAILAATLSLLVPSAAQAAPSATNPWDVPAERRIIAENIRFERAGAQMSGTLYYAEGSRALATMIVFHGAQAPLRSEPLYRHLIQVLPKLGMAVFVFDRRGSGASTQGSVAPGDFEALADDGVAAFAALSRRPQVDPARIGFWGLSQGGWLALQAAAREPKAAFAVAISAPMAGADVQMNFAVANVLRIKGVVEADVQRAIAARTTVDRYTMGKTSRAEAAKAEAGIVGEPWYRDTYIRGNIDDPAWRKQIESDPLQSLDRSKVPTLILYGQGDPWVPVEASLAALKRSAARHSNVDVRVVDGADHAMMLGVDPKQQVDLAFAKSVAPNAPEYFATLGAWLERRGLTQGVR